MNNTTIHFPFLFVIVFLYINLLTGCGPTPTNSVAEEAPVEEDAELSDRSVYDETEVEAMPSEESAMPPTPPSGYVLPEKEETAFPDRSVYDTRTSETTSLPSSGYVLPLPEAAKQEDITTIEVFYGTDRNRTGFEQPAQMYGGDRSKRSNPMEYGICEVTIPPGHQEGKVETPRWWKLEFKPNPEKHVVLSKVENKTQFAFFRKMKSTIQSAGRKEAFVFVHGYNVTFAEAAKRTAQIAYDLQFDGAPIMFSWPSRGETAAYTVDEANIQWTKVHLQDFLKDIAEQSGAETIHLIAHSMGNRALTRAFADLVKEQEVPVVEKFKKVILTAPDIDAEVFKKEIAPAMLRSTSHITLYASSNDLALIASKQVHGYPRAGDSGDQLVVVEGIETIDATEANTGLMGHSYFAESIDIIKDIFKILNIGQRAAYREGLLQRSSLAGQYWLVPGAGVQLASMEKDRPVEKMYSTPINTPEPPYNGIDAGNRMPETSPPAKNEASTTQVNWFSILLASILSLLVSLHWFNPMIFGSTLIKSLNIPEERLHGGHRWLAVAGLFLFTFIAAIFVDNYINHTVESFSFATGLKQGAFIGLLVALPIIGTNVLFQRHNLQYFLITAGYWITSFALLGGILCAMH